MVPVNTQVSPSNTSKTLTLQVEPLWNLCKALSGGSETDVQLQLIRVGIRQPGTGTGGSGGDILAPVDITARYSARTDGSGAPTDDARITVGPNT